LLYTHTHVCIRECVIPYNYNNFNYRIIWCIIMLWLFFIRRSAEGRKGLGYSIFNRPLLFSGIIAGYSQLPLLIFVGQRSAVNGSCCFTFLKKCIVAVGCQNLSARRCPWTWTKVVSPRNRYPPRRRVWTEY